MCQLRQGMSIETLKYELKKNMVKVHLQILEKCESFLIFVVVPSEHQFGFSMNPSESNVPFASI